MLRDLSVLRVRLPLSAILMAGLLGTGCATMEGNIALGAVAVTAAGGRTPNNEMQQIYYLGVFDPLEQIPPTVYRVRVHGQSSIYSTTKFASGWVHADLVDSLGTRLNYAGENNELAFSQVEKLPQSRLQTGRRLVMFGPEGFREAPKDHRLVVVMGSNPNKFFEAMDQSIGVISQALNEKRNDALASVLIQTLYEINNEHQRLKDLERLVAAKPAKTNGEEE